jgi:hypothetical protein
MSPILEFDDVVKSFGSGLTEVRALRGVADRRARRAHRPLPDDFPAASNSAIDVRHRLSVIFGTVERDAMFKSAPTGRCLRALSPCR